MVFPTLFHMMGIYHGDITFSKFMDGIPPLYSSKFPYYIPQGGAP